MLTSCKKFLYDSVNIFKKYLISVCAKNKIKTIFLYILRKKCTIVINFLKLRSILKLIDQLHQILDFDVCGQENYTVASVRKLFQNLNEVLISRRYCASL